jgi:hypothetical protein
MGREGVVGSERIDPPPPSTDTPQANHQRSIQPPSAPPIPPPRNQPPPHPTPSPHPHPTLRNIEQYPASELTPGVLVARLDAPVYFANCQWMRHKLEEYEEEAHA